MKQHKLFYGSSYDRGLQHLLQMWPKIIEKFPDATLDICYGWDLFDKAFPDNPERIAWKERMVKAMHQQGITHHGRISKEELKKVREQCGIWAYPTDFTEINCITALECQQDGVVPVVINLAALKETVQSGVKIEGDIYDEGGKTFDKYLTELLALMGDEKRWKEESEKGKEFAKNFAWEKISKKWEEQF